MKFIMKKYICVVCGYVYDPAEGDPDIGIEPGTAFEDIPDDWVCPLCGVGKRILKFTKNKPTIRNNKRVSIDTLLCF